MLNPRNAVIAASLVLGSLSVQSQAAVVFNDMSYTSVGLYAGVYPVTGPSDYTISLQNMNGAGRDGMYNDVLTPDGMSTIAYANSSASGIVNTYSSANWASVTGSIASDAYAYSSSPNYDAVSFGDAVVDMDLNLSSAYNYNFFSGEFGMSATGNANIYYSLYNLDTSMTVFEGWITSAFSSPIENGVIAAGNYNFIVEAISDGDAYGITGGRASGSFDLELTAVPVPAAVWLFASGLLGLAGVARRKAK